MLAAGLLPAVGHGAVLQLDVPEGEVAVGGDWSKQESTVKGRRTTFTLLGAEEQVTLRERGAVLDPSLFSFSASAGLGLHQLQASDEPGAPRSRVIDYSFFGSLLSKKSYPITVSLERTEDTFNRPFAGTSDVQHERQAVTLGLVDAFLPSHVTVAMDRLDERSRSGLFFSHRDEVHRTLGYTGERSWGETEDLGLSYQLDDVEDLFFAPLSYRLHTGNLTFRRVLGDFRQTQILSSVHYFKREGPLAGTGLIANQDLRTEHTPSLSSAFHYTYSKLDLRDLQSTTHVANASLAHAVYLNLHTTLGLRGARTEFSSGRATDGGGTLDLSYSRQLPGGVLLLLGAGGGYDVEQQQTRAGFFFVSGERHVLALATPAILGHRRVVPGSIVVADETGEQEFQRGFDYEVVAVGSGLAEVRALPAGRLEDDAVVLVSYRYQSSPALTFASRPFSFNVGVEYRGLFLYYDEQRLTQRRLSGAADGSLEQSRSRTAGGQFRWSTDRIETNLLGEYRTTTSTRLSVRALSLGESLVLGPYRDLTATVSATETFFTFPDLDRRSDSTYVRLGGAWNPSPTLSVEAYASFLTLESSLAPHQDALGGGLRLRCRLRFLDVLLAVSRGESEIGDSRLRETSARLTLTRRFSLPFLGGAGAR